MDENLKLLNHLALEFSPLLESANIKTQNVEKTFYTEYSSLMCETI